MPIDPFSYRGFDDFKGMSDTDPRFQQVMSAIKMYGEYLYDYGNDLTLARGYVESMLDGLQPTPWNQAINFVSAGLTLTPSWLAGTKATMQAFGGDYVGALKDEAIKALLPITLRVLANRVGGLDILVRFQQIFEDAEMGDMYDWLGKIGNVTDIRAADMQKLEEMLAENGLYLVQSGDTTASIATKFSLTPETLLRINSEVYPAQGFATGNLIHVKVNSFPASSMPTPLPKLENKQGYLLDYTNGVVYTMGSTPMQTTSLSDQSAEALTEHPTSAQIAALATKYKNISEYVIALRQLYHSTPDATPESLAAVDALYLSSAATVLQQYAALGTNDLWLIEGLANSTTSYAAVQALVQQQGGLVNNARFIYLTAQSDGAANFATLSTEYRALAVQNAKAYSYLAQSFGLDTSLTEAQKQAQLATFEVGIANGLAARASDLGIAFADISTRLTKEAFSLDIPYAMQTMRENISGYIAMLNHDVALSNWLTGTSAANTFNGTSANEIMYGYGGNDFLRGFGGDDVIFGGLGNDTLHGGLGADTVYGGDGDDEFWVGGEEGQAGDTLDGGAGDNVLVSWEGDLSQTSISNIQTVWINTSVKVTAAQFAAFASFNGDATIIAADAGTYDLSEKDVWFGSLNLLGSSGDDYLAGDGTGQTITGGAGNDVLQGNGGADTLLGGDGDDEFLTGFDESPAGEVIDGGAGSNRISSWNADLSAASISNVQTLGAHLDYVTLTAAQLAGFSTLIAYDGTPVTLNAASAGTYSLAGKTLTGTFNLNGSTGNDTLAGGTGAQLLSGGTGNDTYLQVRGGGADTVAENDATSGNSDVLQFGSDVARDQLWFARSGDDLLVQIIGTADSVTVKDWYLGSAHHVEQIKAAGGSNVLLDSQVQNLVNAMAGLALPTTTTLSQTYHNQLDSVIAANWT